jgi:hypothetical protein
MLAGLGGREGGRGRLTRPFLPPGDAAAVLEYYGVPRVVAQGWIEHPERERDLPTVALSRDFLLWLYRDRTGLTWRQLEAQPPWRTERDLAYIGLEAQARAWCAAEQAEELARQQARARRG